MAPMTAYEIISIFIGILALLMSFGSLIVALIAFFTHVFTYSVLGISFVSGSTRGILGAL